MNDQTRLWNERMAEAVAMATQELEQLAKAAERMAEQTRLSGIKQRKQGNVYSAVSGSKTSVKPVKGYDASTAKTERQKSKRAAKEAKRLKQTVHTQHKAPTV